MAAVDYGGDGGLSLSTRRGRRQAVGFGAGSIGEGEIWDVTFLLYVTHLMKYVWVLAYVGHSLRAAP